VAWLKPTDLSSARDIVSKSGSYSLGIAADGRFTFSITASGGSTPAVLSTATASANTTYHVVGTYDGTNLKLYVNGQPAGTQARSGAIVDTANVLRIGQGSTFFQGTIDEVSLYTRPIDATEAQSHYASR